VRERKLKVSVTLSREILERVDRQAKRRGGTRSSIVEAWLKQAARGQAERDLETDTIAYYESLTAEERAEDVALSRALTASARRLDIDGTSPRRRTRRRG